MRYFPHPPHVQQAGRQARCVSDVGWSGRGGLAGAGHGRAARTKDGRACSTTTAQLGATGPEANWRAWRNRYTGGKAAGAAEADALLFAIPASLRPLPPCRAMWLRPTRCGLTALLFTDPLPPFLALPPADRPHGPHGPPTRCYWLPCSTCCSRRLQSSPRYAVGDTAVLGLACRRARSAVPVISEVRLQNMAVGAWLAAGDAATGAGRVCRGRDDVAPMVLPCPPLVWGHHTYLFRFPPFFEQEQRYPPSQPPIPTTTGRRQLVQHAQAEAPTRRGVSA